MTVTERQTDKMAPTEKYKSEEAVQTTQYKYRHAHHALCNYIELNLGSDKSHSLHAGKDETSLSQATKH